MSEIWDKIVVQALTGRGEKLLPGKNVESLLKYLAEKPYVLIRFEAKRIEPNWDRDMPEYSMYGMFPKSGNGIEADSAAMTAKFLELNNLAQENETYAMRYDIWLAEY